ncbi:MAG: hypothetical protein GX163_12280 [Bacteroidetes bacterium]|nr:hypothetical protein [Bacteroidota bacterium]
MKKVFIALCVLFTGINLTAQNCDIFFPMKIGAKMEYEVTDKKNRNISSFEYLIKDVKQSGSEAQATIRATVKEPKGETYQQEFTAICKNGKMEIDYESLFHSSLNETLQGMDFDYTVSGKDIEWPANLSVGQTLPDSEMIMTLSMAGMNMETSVTMTNRKVISKEALTTPAGSFDCYLITYDTIVETMGSSMKTSSKLWISQGIGMIKEEYYEKDKLENTTILTAYSK